ncbi:phospholipase D-like domain-containing protein [Pectobacterium brasiliense]|uniref:phospholipase D family protein n=1 Tax=Pectobacterium brasiliense TaxID=180957 RepID=UPI0019697DC2|nr:phospholipase D family protein [Pectobacterium brasiliense]
MEVSFIAQPYNNFQLGSLLDAKLEDGHDIESVTVVSAFTSRSSIIRLKKRLIALHDATAHIRLVIGVDMGGTSKEVLAELASWPVDVRIFKNRKNGVTFHPKIYVIKRKGAAEIYVGSNNLTEGGLFSNYEGGALVSYYFPDDLDLYNKALGELQQFIDPQYPIARVLDQEFLMKLISRSDIPSEAEKRAREKIAKVGYFQGEYIFGFEATPSPKALPLDYQSIVLAAVDSQLQEIKRSKRAAASKNKRDGKGTENSVKAPLPEIEPIATVPATAFYMELNATKGEGNIPGEQRIPLPAIWAAQSFWGWRENYTRDVNPRKGEQLAAVGSRSEDRVYYNWRPVWEVSEVGKPEHRVIKPVRMYLYENSSDFRFTCGEIKKWGEPGDIIKLEKVDDGEIHYRCQLAKIGTPEHEEWKKICTGTPSANTRRGFGFT